MSEDRHMKLGTREITLESALLKFDEHTINEFLRKEAGNYATYTAYHADAQYVHSKYEDRYEALYAEKFKLYREESSSDKMAEMKTKSDNDVQEALELVRLAKHNTNLLWGFVRSMDRAHDNAREFCFNMRKELNKLFNNTIKHSDLV